MPPIIVILFFASSLSAAVAKSNITLPYGTDESMGPSNAMWILLCAYFVFTMKTGTCVYIHKQTHKHTHTLTRTLIHLLTHTHKHILTHKHAFLVKNEFKIIFFIRKRSASI